MTTDMLRLAGEGEEMRTEAFAEGEAVDLRRGPTPASGQPIDLRALVMRAVVPRLAENLRDRAPHRPPVRAPAIDERCGRVVDDLIDTLLRGDLAGACRAVDEARASGRPLDHIYLDALAPAAAAIARLVEADDCSAAAGTLAFCNLQLLLRRYAADFYEEGGVAPRGCRALLVPRRAPGVAAAGLPVFGLLLAADFLRRAGWDASIEASMESESFCAAVRGQWFDLVEVVADDAALDAEAVLEMACAIRSIRRDGPNPRVVVVVCGPAFARRPELPALVGADDGVPDPLSTLFHGHHVFHHASRWQAQEPRPLS